MKYQINPIHLTELLKKSTDILQLNECYDKHKDVFNQRHFSIVCSVLCRFTKSPNQISIFIDSTYNWMNCKDCEISDFIIILQSAAKLKIRHPILNKLFQQIKYLYKLFNPQNTVDVIWSTAILNINDPEILSYLIEAIKINYQSFDGINISTIIWSCATLNLDDRKLILYIIDSIKSNYQLFNAQCISTIIWACAVLNIYDSELLEQLISIIKCNYYLFNFQGITQIKQAFLFYKIVDIKIDKIFDELNENNTTISEFQKTVGATIEYLGYDIIYEKKLLNNVYSGDIDIKYNKRKLIIECDGPYHFLSDNTFNGSTLLRNKLYDMYEIKYISISYFEYKSVSRYELYDYLKKKIDNYFEPIEYNRYLENMSRKRYEDNSRDINISRDRSRSRDRNCSRDRSRSRDRNCSRDRSRSRSRESNRKRTNWDLNYKCI